MKKKISLSKLEVGMYVILDLPWFKHPFLKGEFFVKTDTQLKEILSLGIKEVYIDLDREDPEEEVETITHPSAPPPPELWKPEKDITEDLKEAIENRQTPPKKKAEAVYRNSIELMNKLLANPTSEIIGQGKKGISHMVDLILSDDETSHHLLQITSHDFYTYTHSVNVGVLSVSLAKRLYNRSDGHDMHEMGAGFFLHDLGKVRVDPLIINKPSRLTEGEMKKMRVHPYQSYKILQETHQLSEEAGIVAMQHHERADGKGYPNGLKEEEIHEYGRICCIADVFDALTAERSYKRSLKPFDALKVMKEEMISHFHKRIFNNFVQLFE